MRAHHQQQCTRASQQFPPMTIMPVLVLLPGLDGTGLLLSDLAASLGTGVLVVIATYPTDSPAGYAGLEAVARSFLPSDQPFFLLAESFSGPIGIAIAASAPPGLRGLVLSCSFARNPRPVLALLRPMIAAMSPARLPLRLLDILLLGRFTSAALRDSLVRSLARVTPKALRARALAALSVDATAALRSVRVPVLYLRAAHDRVVPRASSKHIASSANNVRIVEFDAPHFLLQVLPAQAASVIMKFTADSGIRI
jgi:pimeloyl-ACP methyl ester carboxylesterase